MEYIFPLGRVFRETALVAALNLYLYSGLNT